MKLLVRNRVEDFDRWFAVFRDPAEWERMEGSGLRLTGVWRSCDDPNTVFFAFDVDDRARAEAFMAQPESAEAGRRAGVIEGEAHFVERIDL